MLSLFSQVSLTYLTSLRNDERISHQLDVKFQEMYLKKVCALLRCNLHEGAVASKAPAEIGESVAVEGDKAQDPMDVEEGELPDSQGEYLSLPYLKRNCVFQVEG